MAYPVVQTYSSGSNNSNLTSHPVTLPSGIGYGDLILVFFGTDGVTTQSVDTNTSGFNWVQYSTNYVGTGDSGVSAAVYYKYASESNTLNINTTDAQYSSYVVYRITGYDGQLQYSYTGANSSNPDLPNCPAGVTPVNVDSLWVAAVIHNGTIVCSVAPTDFTNLITQAGTGSESCSVSSARRSYTGTYLDPNVFTADTGLWVGWLIKIMDINSVGVGFYYPWRTVSTV